MFETQKSGNKTRSGEIGLDIRTHASPKVGQDQVSRGVSVLCWYAAPVANILTKPHTDMKKYIKLPFCPPYFFQPVTVLYLICDLLDTF